MPAIPQQLILFSIFPIVYSVYLRQKGVALREAFSWIGWVGGPPIWYLWALLVTVLLGILGFIAFQLIPPEIFDHPNLTASRYTGLTIRVSTILLIFTTEAISVALGEEIFFRGFLGGWLFRRLGFLIGNMVQSVLFLLPHLLLLTISIGFLPLIPIQFAAGWVYGWLRCRSGSILPGWLSHSLINTFSAAVIIANM